MSAIQLIERFKVPLLALELVFVVAFVAELSYFSGMGAVQLSRALKTVVLLPPLGVWACFFPLCYYFWFRNPASPGSRPLKLMFFWLLLLGSAIIWINIIWISLGLGR